MIKFLDGDAINAKIIETIKQADEYQLFEMLACASRSKKMKRICSPLTVK